LIRVLGIEDGVEQGVDSFISHKPAIGNLERIRAAGLSVYLEEQRERLELVQRLLDGYNEGRSMSFYCRATALMPPHLIRQALDGIADKATAERPELSNLKVRARAMRGLIQDLATEARIDINLRRKKKAG
jgi:hypothetical protein